jgi:DNA-binding response OmpR family regulator
MNTKIVIIEDSEDIRETTAELLELSGYTVLQAANGLEGVRLVKAELPDLIICDIMMPHLDGFGVLQVLGQSPELARIPFIFLTAKTDRSDLRKGMELGADDFLTKPFQEIELLKAIETRLKKSKLVEEPARNFDNYEKSDVLLAQKALEFLDLSTFKGDVKSQSFSKKSSIYNEGDSPSRVYFLESGKLKTYHTSQEGKLFITSFVNEGDFFGFVDVLENQSYRESAEALEDCKILSISSSDFLRYINENVHLEVFFRKALTAYLFQNEKILFSMAYQSLRKRVALALIELAETFGGTINKPFTIRLSREDLANRVGTATESVIRTLSEFKKEGLVEVKGGEMTILDLKALMGLKY